jgi:hypothetical protein
LPTTLRRHRDYPAYNQKKEMQLRRIRDPMLKSIATALPQELLEMIYVLSQCSRYDLRLSTRHRRTSYRY